MENISADRFYSFIKDSLKFFGLEKKEKELMELIVEDVRIGFHCQGEYTYINLAKED